MNWKQQSRLFIVPGILLAMTLAVMMYYGYKFGLLPNGIWYDKIMHTLGGAGGCVLAFCVITNLPDRWRWSFLRFGLPLIGLAAGLFFGGWWEVLEVQLPVITDYVPQGVWDTFFDIVFDCVGGYIAGKRYQEIWRWQLA